MATCFYHSFWACYHVRVIEPIAPDPYPNLTEDVAAWLISHWWVTVPALGLLAFCTWLLWVFARAAGTNGGIIEP